MNNAKDAQLSFSADKVIVEIVTHGSGIHMLQTNSLPCNRNSGAAQSV
ncbi:MAG: hypothetical protein R3E42_19270 [Burkholderiaceae bacterium]